MAYEIIVPRLGWSMEEGFFGEWLFEEGQLVRAGEMLFVLEGGKALQEIESFETGVLHIPKSAPQSGDRVEVGQRLAYLLAPGESPPPDSIITPASEPSRSSDVAASPLVSTAKSNTRHLCDDDSKVASPRARRRADELGVDWRDANGSGANGRVRECDVIALAERRAK